MEALALGSARRGEPLYCVQVSARLLHFPNFCCCCGARDAGGQFCAVATRTTGKKVVRTESRSWKFPLCDECQPWMQQQHAANAARGWFFGLVLFAVLGVVGGIGLLPSPAGCLGIVVGMLLGGGAPFFYISWQRSQKTADQVKPAPHCVVRPVVYDSWSGSVHTFYFACREFTERFRAANARKLLG